MQPIPESELIHVSGLGDYKPLSIAWLMSIGVHLIIFLSAVFWLNEEKGDVNRNNDQQLHLILAMPESTRDTGRDKKITRPSTAKLTNKRSEAQNRNQLMNLEVASEPQPQPKKHQIETKTQTALREETSVLKPLEASGSDAVIAVASSVSVKSFQPTRATTVDMPNEQQKMLQQHLIELRKELTPSTPEAIPLQWSHDNQLFSASVTHIRAQNNTEHDSVLVEIRTQVDGVNMSAKMKMKRLAFSHYAQIINRWDPDVSISRDEIDGRFHANSKIIVDAQRKKKPKFNGKVTTTSSIKIVGYGPKSVIFEGGYKTGARRISFPKRLTPQFSNKHLQATVFDQNATITFSETGGFYWFNNATPHQVNYQPKMNLAQHLLAHDKVTLSVKGIVNGTVVVYARQKIIIAGDLIYSNNPEGNPQSMDFLGLISERYIEVAPPDITGSGDLTINAAIYARRRFQVKNISRRGHALLSIYGSLTAGTLSATEPRFATLIRFDKRFEKIRLPDFPVTDQYELETWNPQWQIHASNNVN
jgi:hypothetical protein